MRRIGGRGLSVAAHQGIQGSAALWTGDIPVLHNGLVEMFKQILATEQLAVLIFDKTSIAVPANERACWLRRELNDSDNLEVQVVYAPLELSHNLCPTTSWHHCTSIGYFAPSPTVKSSLVKRLRGTARSEPHSTLGAAPREV